jgi:hypothetical protein
VPRYVYAGDAPASDEHLEATLRALHAAGKLRGTILEAGVAAAWAFPADMPEAERVRIRQRMFGHVMAVDGDARPPANSTAASGRRPEATA